MEAASIEEIIKQFKLQGINHYDPVRFRCIESMAAKLNVLKPSISSIVETNIKARISSYEADFKQEKVKLSLFVEQLCLEFPEYTETILNKFNANKFESLSRFAHKLRLQQSSLSYKALNKLFIFSDSDKEHSQEQLSFDEFLLYQENEALQSVDEVGVISVDAAQPNELKSHKVFKDSWVRLHAERLVSQAIKEAPENAGPLNSHMLAIRSLTAMKELSPDYLNRFVSYMDSLLWLEQTVEAASLKATEKGGKQRKRK